MYNYVRCSPDFEAMYRQIMNQAIKVKGNPPSSLPGFRNFLRKFNIDIRRKLFGQIHDLGGHIRMFISGAAAMDPQGKGVQRSGHKYGTGLWTDQCSPIVALNGIAVIRMMQRVFRFQTWS